MKQRNWPKIYFQFENLKSIGSKSFKEISFRDQYCWCEYAWRKNQLLPDLGVLWNHGKRAQMSFAYVLFFVIYQYCF